jgi:hypothetical protein
MTKADRDALQRALKIAGEDLSRAGQLASKLKTEPWQDVAAFAAAICQSKSLRLRPWESPPACLEAGDEDFDNGRNRAGVRLLERLEAAGLSRYEPDPLAALEALQGRRRA